MIRRKLFKKITLSPSQQIIYLNAIKNGIDRNLATHFAVNEIEDFEKFISPVISKLRNPLYLKDAQKIADVIDSYGKFKRSGLTIVGDYDCDGITASAVVKWFMRLKYNYEVNVFIPERENGYGLTKTVVDKITPFTETIITVDNGITASEAIKYAKKNNIDTYVTDHHSIQGDLYPYSAKGVVNPKDKNCNYGFRDLSGVGVIWSVLRLIDSEIAEELTPLVSIGTIADVVPLIDDNRVLTVHGLNNTQKTIIPFISKNMYSNSTDIAFKLAPIINASGRMGYAKMAFNALIEKDEKNIPLHEKNLFDFNTKRKEIQLNAESEVFKTIEETAIVEKYNNSLILTLPVNLFLSDNERAHIEGILASRVVEDLNVPVIIFGDSKEYLSGSGRGPDWFDFTIFIEALKKENLLIKGGGHKKACGLTIAKDNLDRVRDIFDYIAKALITEDSFIKEVYEIYEYPDKTLLTSIRNTFKQIEPVGERNKLPEFAFKSSINEPKILGKNTLTFRLDSGVRCVMFNFRGSINDLNLKEEWIIGKVIEKSFVNENGETINYTEIEVTGFGELVDEKSPALPVNSSVLNFENIPNQKERKWVQETLF